jgi:peptidoglycan/LPS O-acetylase OafA/YrhL
VPARGSTPSRRSGSPSTVRLGQHLRYLDSIRGLSALYVAACHAWLMYAVQFADQGLRSTSGGLLVATSWLAFGRSAVAVFIVLSGYCLMLPVVQSPARELRLTFWQFMARRARRILPPYYGALAISIALILMIPSLQDASIGEWHKSFPAISTGSVASHLLLLHNYVPAYQYAIDHPLWSVATEWQIYFLFPLLVWIGRNYGDFRVVTVSVAITAALSIFIVSAWPDHNPWPPQFVALFGFGMACAAWSFPREIDAKPLNSRRWRRRATLLLTVGAASNLVFATTNDRIPDLLIGAGVGCALVFLTDAMVRGRRPFTLRVLELRPLIELGRFSYSLYLLHAPILALFFLLARRCGLGMVEFQLFILGIALPATVAASHLFFLVFERPFLNPPASLGQAPAALSLGSQASPSSGHFERRRWRFASVLAPIDGTKSTM